LDLAFFSNGILGGKLKIKNILQIQIFIKVSCLIKRIFIGWSLNFNPLSRIAPYFIILLCSTPDDFTLQREIMLGLNG
jgi:hypothetical protein